MAITAILVASLFSIALVFRSAFAPVVVIPIVVIRDQGDDGWEDETDNDVRNDVVIARTIIVGRHIAARRGQTLGTLHRRGRRKAGRDDITVLGANLHPLPALPVIFR